MSYVYSTTKLRRRTDTEVLRALCKEAKLATDGKNSKMATRLMVWHEDGNDLSTLPSADEVGKRVVQGKAPKAVAAPIRQR